MQTQESSLTPQFKSINSSVLGFLHSPTLTSTHDHWKTIALTRRTFAGKVIHLLFNKLSRLALAFLPRSRCSFNFMAAVTIAVILETKKIKSVTVSTVSPTIHQKVMGQDAMILVF